MIKKLTEFLDYAVFAELALILFAIIFVTVVIRTLRMGNETARQQANIVLDDKTENQV